MNVNTSFRISPATIPGEDGAPGVQDLQWRLGKVVEA